MFKVVFDVIFDGVVVVVVFNMAYLLQSNYIRNDKLSQDFALTGMCLGVKQTVGWVRCARA